MISKYDIFCRVVENGNFTRVAEEIGYSQSAVSQTIKSLEQELGTILIDRKKDGIELTDDGRTYMPYIQSVSNSINSLDTKRREMTGLMNSTIRIGTFTSVSRNLLPDLMIEFKKLYPEVHFVLMQGEYTGIERWIKEGSIDFGFISADAARDITTRLLYTDEMKAVLPATHRLAERDIISLQELKNESFILLDEGEYSLPIEAFRRENITPHIEYKVYDDYSILAMIKRGLGVSILYDLVVKGYEKDLAIISISESVRRNVALGWNNWNTMPYAARKFAEFVIERMKFNHELT